MLVSQNPETRVLNLKTRIPKSMREPGFFGSGSNPGSIPIFGPFFAQKLVIDRTLVVVLVYQCQKAKL